MAHGFPRRLRVAAIMQAELAVIVPALARDAMATVVQVDVNRDLSIAKIYCNALAGSAAELAQQLDEQHGKIRTQLAHKLRLRKIPQLHFVCTVGSIDESS